MRWTLALILYRLLLPLLFLAAFPGWVVKMLRRNGLGTDLLERAAIHTRAIDFEPSGALHIHSVSVGETLLAIKLIRTWRQRDPQQKFVLATGTATGHHVATEASIDGLRVTYAPLDFKWMVRRYLNRFEPTAIVLIEGEVWPHLILACEKRGIPVSLVNARTSPRSARRYRRFAAWIQPLFSRLTAVAIQEREDSKIWRDLGVPAERIEHTGSLKFDPGSGEAPSPRPQFQQMLERFTPHQPIILAASTHPGEHAWIARAAQQADADALIAIAPRHAERRVAVQEELQKAGFNVVLRSAIASMEGNFTNTVFVIDSTGELRDWIAHADIVVIGKSFLSRGGQNPSEAIRAGKPVIFGPHMENFQPLADKLVASGGAIQADTADALKRGIINAMDPKNAATMQRNSLQTLQSHEGATARIIDLIQRQ